MDFTQKRKDKLSLHPEPTQGIRSPEITYCTDQWSEHYENFPFLAYVIVLRNPAFVCTTPTEKGLFSVWDISGFK